MVMSMERPFEQSPEYRSEKERKEHEAFERIREEAVDALDRALERAEREEAFSSPDKRSTKRFPVESAVDHMVAVAQNEREEAEAFLERVRERGEYYEEKTAAKLRAFLRREEALLRSFAEMEALFPDLAELLKERKPYLKEKISSAEKGWKKK